MGILVSYFLTILYLSQRGANYVKTPKKDIDVALQVLKKGDIFIDLGFGNGEVLEAAVAKGASLAIGYDLDFFRFLKTWWTVRENARIKLIYRDIWFADLSRADVVYTFFTDIHMARLYKKAQREMRKGSWFISFVHTVPDIKPTRQIGNVQFFKI